MSVSGALDFNHKSTLELPITVASFASGAVWYASAVPASGAFHSNAGSFAHGVSWWSVGRVVSCACAGSYTYESAPSPLGASATSDPSAPKYHGVALVPGTGQDAKF